MLYSIRRILISVSEIFQFESRWLLKPVFAKVGDKIQGKFRDCETVMHRLRSSFSKEVIVRPVKLQRLIRIFY